jgi:hypothetical protein
MRVQTVAAQVRFAVAASLLVGAAGACQGPNPYYRHLGLDGGGAITGSGGYGATTGGAGYGATAGFASGAAGATLGAAGTTGAAGTIGVGGTTGAAGTTSTGASGAIGAAGVGAPCLTCQVKVEYTCRAMEDCPDAGTDGGGSDGGMTGVGQSQASFVLDITNEGPTTFPLSALTLRYWYTLDELKPQELDCDFAKLGCTNIVTSMSTTPPNFVEVMPPRAHANEYSEIAFTAGALSLEPRLDTGEIQLRIHNKDFSPIMQCDDYSYDCPTTITTIDAQKITAYINDVLVWGTEPQ